MHVLDVRCLKFFQFLLEKTKPSIENYHSIYFCTRKINLCRYIFCIWLILFPFFSRSKSMPVPWRFILTSWPAWSIGITTFGRIWVHYIFIISGPMYMKTVLGFSIQAVHASSFFFFFYKLYRRRDNFYYYYFRMEYCLVYHSSVATSVLLHSAT